eukprot:618247_1
MTTTNSESILDELFQSYSPLQPTTSANDDSWLSMFEDHNTNTCTSSTTIQTQSIAPATLEKALFGDLCFDVMPSVRTMITKQYNDEHELKLTEDTKFPLNKTYSFKSIHISDCTIAPSNGAGIIYFRSLNDIVLENATIAFQGTRKTYKIPKQLLKKNKLLNIYGRELNQIYVGHEGRPGDSCAGGAGGNGIAFECKRMILRNSHINISGAEGSRMWWSGDGEGGACLIRCDELEMDDNSTIEKGRVVVQINPKTKSNIRYLVRGYFRTHFDCNIADICDLCMSYFALPSYLELNKRIKEATFVDSEWNAFSPEQLVKEAITILKPGLKIKFAFKDDINDIHDWRKMRHYWLNLNAYERGELTANVMRNAIQNVMKKIGITLDCNRMDLDWLFFVIVWSCHVSDETYGGYAKYRCLELDIWNKLKLRDFDHSDRIVLLCQSTKTLKMLQNKDSINDASMVIMREKDKDDGIDTNDIFGDFLSTVRN